MLPQFAQEDPLYPRSGVHYQHPLLPNSHCTPMSTAVMVPHLKGLFCRGVVPLRGDEIRTEGGPCRMEGGSGHLVSEVS